MDGAAHLLVSPDVTVDGLTADPQDTSVSEPVGDLFWAPAIVDEGADQLSVLLSETPVRQDLERRAQIIRIASLGR